jgi:molybdate transport system substrate-binding protein
MKPKTIIPILLIVGILFSACAPRNTPLPAASQNNTPQSGPAVALTVLAAASLTEPFQNLGTQFEGSHPGVKVEFSFAGSQQLAQQLGQGAPADVFASASNTYMKSAVDSGRVDQAAVKTFANNRLVVIVPKANPAGIDELKDLARPGLKLDLAAKEVPVGQYSLDFLDKATQDASLGKSYKDSVLKNVVSYEDNVKVVLAKISLGEADGGIVYSSDVSASTAAKVIKIAIPDNLNVLATYPIAPLKDIAHAQLAQAFVDLVMSAQGQAVLADYGFIPVNENP